MAKILIIEDKRALSKLYLLLLGQAGHDVQLAYTGEDGVEQATRERPDLIFLDLRLPGISGAEVAQKLWDSGVLPGVPLIIASGLEDEGKKVAQYFGASGALTKPVKVGKMAAAVKCALNSPRATAAALASGSGAAA